MSNYKKTTNQRPTALITGAANGIGLATAKFLASKKYNVLLVDRNSKQLKRLKTLLQKQFSVKVLISECDVTRTDELQLLRKKIGKINFLVNIAGKSIGQAKGVLDEAAFDQLIEANLKSVYLTSMIFGYKSIKNGGAIVNIASIRARTGTPSYSSGYAAAKAGIINITKSFALELAEKNIRVNAIAPGPTYPTKMSKNWSIEFRQELAQSVPLKRLARPEDIASAVWFLLSNNASYITGHTLDVNGGLWMN